MAQRRVFWASVLVGLSPGLALFAAGCSCGPVHATDGPCDVAEQDRPEACGQACSSSEPCPAGFYCHASGVCTADCLPADPSASCPPPGTCTADGVCLRPDSGSQNSPDSGGRIDASGCANVNVETRRVTPNVIVIIDQSASMTENFGATNRWDGLRDSLMAEPDGLIYSFQSLVRFGIALYSADQPNDNEPVPGMCPLITWVDPAIDNHAAINAVYGPADVIDETPTGESIDAVLTLFTSAPDPSSDPTIFILATDGEPDTCAEPNPQRGQDESLAAVQRAYNMGIRTFVISVGSEISESHLQDMADTGAGVSNAPYWVAGDDEGLREALSAIIGGELSCVVELNGRIDDVEEACGPGTTVRLGGQTLTCGDPNGWRVVDPTHIELLGEACETFQSGPGVRLDAVFPCGIILI